jgi:phage terminase Nu1 subunit (DNA packaging protein)
VAGRKRTPDEIPHERITQTEAGRRLGITRQAIGAWMDREGAPVEVDDQGQRWVVWPDFARWREHQLVDTEARQLAQVSDLDYQRSRKTRLEADLVELELHKALGALVALTDYESALATVLQRLTARLRAMPPRLAEHGPDVEAAVEREVEDVVKELHDWDEDVADDPDEDTRAA